MYRTNLCADFSAFGSVRSRFGAAKAIGGHSAISNVIYSKRAFSTAYANGDGGHNSAKSFDILVVGGGMVGAALACALASTPITSKQKIAVIESAPPPKLEKISKLPELRVSAINSSSVELFKAIGAWNSMEETRVAPYYKMEVWDAAGPGSIHFDNSSDSRTEPLGYMIENNVIQAALFKRMQSFSNVETFCPSAIESIQLAPEGNDDWVKIKTKDGQNMRARLVVGADGGDSTVRNAAKIPTYGWSYNQKGIVAVVEHKEPNYTAWQRFLPSGPIALLPMFHNYSNIVWSTTPAQAETLLSLSDEQFLAELRRGFTSRLDPGSYGFDMSKLFQFVPVPLPDLAPPTPRPPHIERLVGKRAAFPLRLTHASEYIRSRVAIIGDAAHTVHPLAGQGVNLGFADATALASIIIEGVRTGQDIGSTLVLKGYQEQRMTSNMAMMTGIEGIKRLFDSSLMPFTVARNVGLTITNAFTPVKQQLMKYAMGATVDVSKIGVKQKVHPKDTMSWKDRNSSAELNGDVNEDITMTVSASQSR
jgi:ubiquinone biosynthesis UbiH/UbiF/VisC/COQ6 family hydroxylase